MEASTGSDPCKRFSQEPAHKRYARWAVTDVAIKRFFEIAISPLEIGGLLTPRSRVLLIA
jgi:hypothetical protein